MNINLILEKVHASYSTPISLYQEGKLVKSFNSYNFHPDPANFIMEPYLDLPYQMCFAITPDYLTCGLLHLKQSNQYIILGPVSPFTFTIRQATSILEMFRLPKSNLQDVLRWFHELPVVGTSSFRSTLEFLNLILNEDSENTPVHVSYQVPHPALSLKIVTPPISILDDEIEHKMLQCIAYGRPEMLKQIYDSIRLGGEIELPNLGSNSFRSIKNAFIGSAAIASRAAVSGGLNNQISYSLANYYISAVEKLTTYLDVEQLLEFMLIDYAKRVELSSLPDSDSATVHAIYKDVQIHLYEKLSSNDIAKHLNLDRSYLCHHFKEKTGKTILNYIHEQKIKEACYLLETTVLTIVIIADQLGYSSQQHFQSVFKKITGKTPGRFASYVFPDHQSD